MSGAYLSLILYSRLYLVQGLVITVRRLVIMATNVCVTLSCQVYHSMMSSSSLKTSNPFALFSLFQQRASAVDRFCWKSENNANRFEVLRDNDDIIE